MTFWAQASDYFLRFGFLICKMVIILLLQLNPWEVDSGDGDYWAGDLWGVSLRPTSTERRPKEADWAQGHTGLWYSLCWFCTELWSWAGPAGSLELGWGGQALQPQVNQALDADHPGQWQGSPHRGWQLRSDPQWHPHSWEAPCRAAVMNPWLNAWKTEIDKRHSYRKIKYSIPISKE